MAKVYNNFFDAEIWDKVNKNNKQLLEDFLMELKQNKKSPQTCYQYESDIKGFFCWMIRKYGAEKDVLEMSKRDFRTYSLYLTGECGLSNARHNRLMSSVRSMLTFAENDDEEYDYQVNTAKKVRGLPKESVREIFFLTNDQIEKLKNELIHRGEYQKATLLCLAYDSAARKGELAGVTKYSFYDEKLNNTNKVIGKRRKVFTLLYFDWTKECAKLWLDQRGEDKVDSMWLVSLSGDRKSATKENIYEWFMYMRKVLAEIEGVEIDFNVHSLRHSALQAMSDGTFYYLKKLGMEKGFPLEKLKLYAHHESVDTTNGYLKDMSNDELENMFGIKIEE